jgi:hypothetical protein
MTHTIHAADAGPQADYYSIGHYDGAKYTFDPAAALAIGDRPDGELLALEAEMDRFWSAHEYVTHQVDELDGDAWDVGEKEMCRLMAAHCDMVIKMWSIPATTNAGRQAKARTAFQWVIGPGFRSAVAHGADEGTKIVELIAELCGMSPLALANCHY